MKALWKSLSKPRQIAVLVLFGHFLFLFALSINHLMSNRISPKKPIAIRVVSPPPSIATKPGTSSKKLLPAKPLAKRETKKNAPAKRKAKNTTSSYDSTLLNELQKNLDALSSPSPTPAKSAPLSIPKSIEKKASATIEQSTDSSYAESLVFYLQNSLELPELGDVKLSLEISANGAIRCCEILEAKSRRNADFLKKRLPELTFPCFNSAQAKSFTIVFRNVEIH